MLRKDLAEQLGISGAMVSKLAKRGMPTGDVDAAAVGATGTLKALDAKSIVPTPGLQRGPAPLVLHRLLTRWRQRSGSPTWGLH